MANTYSDSMVRRKAPDHLTVIFYTKRSMDWQQALKALRLMGAYIPLQCRPLIKAQQFIIPACGLGSNGTIYLWRISEQWSAERTTYNIHRWRITIAGVPWIVFDFNPGISR